MTRKDEFRQLEGNVLALIETLHHEYDEDPTDRVADVREMYVRENWFGLMDAYEHYKLRLMELRAGV